MHILYNSHGKADAAKRRRSTQHQADAASCGRTIRYRTLPIPMFSRRYVCLRYMHATHPRRQAPAGAGPLTPRCGPAAPGTRRAAAPRPRGSSSSGSLPFEGGSSKRAKLQSLALKRGTAKRGPNTYFGFRAPTAKA